MAVWDAFLTPRDREVFARSGHGSDAGLGARPALLIIDVVYGFCGHEPAPILESLDTWPQSCGEAAWDAIPRIARVVARARDAGVPVIYTTAPDPRQPGMGLGLWRRSRLNERPEVEGYPEMGIVREVAPAADDIVVVKTRPSAFHGTHLPGLLIELGVDTLLVCGTTTSGCVRASVVDAFSYNLRVGLIEDCVFDRGEASHALSLFDMNAKYADLLTADEACSYLAGSSVAGVPRQHLDPP